MRQIWGSGRAVLLPAMAGLAAILGHLTETLTILGPDWTNRFSGLRPQVSPQPSW